MNQHTIGIYMPNIQTRLARIGCPRLLLSGLVKKKRSKKKQTNVCELGKNANFSPRQNARARTNSLAQSQSMQSTLVNVRRAHFNSRHIRDWCVWACIGVYIYMECTIFTTKKRRGTGCRSLKFVRGHADGWIAKLPDYIVNCAMHSIWSVELID